MRKIRWATVIAAALMIAGCSPNEAPAEQSPAPAPNGHGAYAKCLQEHGISAPAGPVAGPPPGVDQDVWHKASQVCATLAPGPSAG
jgi:hypothetical protein